MIELSLLCFDRLHMESLLPRIHPLVDSVHLDIMDGKLTAEPGGYSPAFINGFETDLPKHVHVMALDPRPYLDRLEGIDTFSFHIEAVPEPGDLLEAVADRGFGAGLVLNPETPVAAVEPWLDALERVVLMAVPPGRSGQPYLPGTSQKLTDLRTLDPHMEIVVDGGMHEDTMEEVKRRGADSCVVCSVIVKSGDPEGKVAQLRTSLANGSALL